MRLILASALPLMLGNAFQQMYTMADASVVGRGVGLAALAALGSADWFNWLFVSIAQGLAHGFSLPVARLFGAKDHKALRRYAGSAATLGMISAAVVTALALAAIRPVLAWMGTPAEVRPVAAGYLTIIFSGLPAVMASSLLAGMLRALGDSRSPLMAMTAASLVNILLDLLFVLCFGWGVNGAAAATVIAQVLSCVLCLLRLRRVPFMRLARSDLGFDRKRFGDLLRLGLPVSGQNCVIAVGGMIVQSVVNGMGVAFIAGYTAASRLYGLLEIAAVSYGYALASYAGQNLGARRPDRLRSGLRAGVASGVGTALVIAALMLIFGRSILSLFIDASPRAGEALEAAVRFLRLMALCLPILYVLHVYRSALQGMGNTVTPMISGLAELLMRTGAALLLPGLIGPSGVFWAEILAWLGADMILIPSCHMMLRRLSRVNPGCVDSGGGGAL